MNLIRINSFCSFAMNCFCSHSNNVTDSSMLKKKGLATKRLAHFGSLAKSISLVNLNKMRTKKQPGRIEKRLELKRV